MLKLNEIVKSIVGNIKEGNIVYDFLGKKLKINYTLVTNAKSFSEFYGVSYLKDFKIDFNLCVLNGIPYVKYFDDIIYYEILHIYQYLMNRENYLEDVKYKKTYNLIGQVISEPQYSNEDKVFASALYMSYDFEQDAMVHGLYATLASYKKEHLYKVFQNIEDYQYLYDLQYAISNIQNFNESLFGISKTKCLKILKIAYYRYKTKLSKAYQKSYDEYNFEGLINFKSYEQNNSNN